MAILALQIRFRLYEDICSYRDAGPISPSFYGNVNLKSYVNLSENYFLLYEAVVTNLFVQRATFPNHCAGHLSVDDLFESSDMSESD